MRKFIPNTNDLYEITDDGIVISYNKYPEGHELKSHPIGDGYKAVTIKFNDGKFRMRYIHRLVAEAFVPNPNNYPIVNHKDENKDNNKKSAYVCDWVAKMGEYSWNITNFNNNNWNNWTVIKCGSKNDATVASIATATPIPNKVTKVIVTYGQISTPDKVKSASLIVASDEAFSNVKETVPITLEVASSKVEKEYVISAPVDNAYYKLVYDMNKTGSNGIIQVSKLEYVRSK